MMMLRLGSLIATVALVFATVGVPTVAAAHTRVVSSTPAEGARVARPRTLTLTFNEALLPPTTSASVIMTTMPGMANHNPMAIRNFQTVWSNGNKTLRLNFRQPLRAGTYELRWQAAGNDGHRMTGTIHFTVS